MITTYSCALWLNTTLANISRCLLQENQNPVVTDNKVLIFSKGKWIEISRERIYVRWSLKLTRKTYSLLLCKGRTSRRRHHVHRLRHANILRHHHLSRILLLLLRLLLLLCYRRRLLCTLHCSAGWRWLSVDWCCTGFDHYLLVCGLHYKWIAVGS